MLSFLGRNDKHDWTVALGCAIMALTDEQVTIVSDRADIYEAFEGDVSRVEICTPREKPEGFIIFDCYETILGPDTVPLFVTTDYQKTSVEFARGVLNKMKDRVTGLVVEEQESTISKKYIDSYLGDVEKFEYESNITRKIDCVYEGRIRFRNLDESFTRSINKFLVENLQVDQKDLKNLWTQLRKGG